MSYEFWTQFIEILKENPCIWNTKGADYNNKAKRTIAIGMLVEKLWAIDENADVTTVTSKINSFRSQFQREYIKIKKNQDSEPQWEYFNSLKFLLPTMPFYENNNEERSKPEKDHPESSQTEPLKEATVLDINTPKRIKLEEKANGEDDASTFAAHLTTRMRAFEPQQKCIAQKLISDVMFLAETKQLRLTSTIVHIDKKD